MVEVWSVNTSLGIHIISDLTWSTNTHAHTHILPSEEGPTKALLPQEAEKYWDLPSASDKLLQMRASHIAADPTHPGQKLFVPLEKKNGTGTSKPTRAHRDTASFSEL